MKVTAPDNRSMFGIGTEKPVSGPAPPIALVQYTTTVGVINAVDSFNGQQIEFASLAFGSDGNLWCAGFTASSDSFAIIRMSGDFPNNLSATVFPVPGLSSNDTMALGSDKNLWFTLDATGQVGRITPTGNITLFQPSKGDHGATALISAPDGNLWFLDERADALIRVNPADGSFSPFRIPIKVAGSSMFAVNRLAVGSDGNIWLTSGGVANSAVIAFDLPKSGSPPPAAPATVGSYLSNTYRHLTGVPLANDRLQTILRSVLGANSKVTSQTTLDSLAEIRRAKLLQNLSRAILRTPEYRHAQLEQISASTLLHPADKSVLGARGPIEAVRWNVLGSRRYETTRAGGRNSALVAAYYRDILGRAPTASDSLFWMKVLDRGVSRQRVATIFARSDEGLAHTVQREYRRLLGRSAAPGELATQVKTLRRTNSADNLILTLVTSPEYFGRR